MMAQQSALFDFFTNFPFLSAVLEQAEVSILTIRGITVMEGDINLLSVRPCSWEHDMGSFGRDEGSRLFWAVDRDACPHKLDFSHCSSLALPGQEQEMSVTEKKGTIGQQLRAVNGFTPVYLVEVFRRAPDPSNKFPYVVVYDVTRLDWAACYRTMPE